MPGPVKTFSKTRIAPTPSGFLHLGNILSFAMTARLAHQHNTKILLRVDDLDRPRVNIAYLQDVFDTLNFLEIPWHDGPRNVQEFEESHSQLHRIPLYHDALKQLSDSGRLYACACSRKQLQSNSTTGECRCFKKKMPLDAAGVSWRLLTREKTEISVRAYNSPAIHAQLPAEMHNIIVRKKDGNPSYQLTSLIDDLYYGVDLVVRGDDLWPSTLAQQEIAALLGRDEFSRIYFYHHPLITDQSGLKLSKSAGATSVKYLRENGMSASGIFMLIAGLLDANNPAQNWQQLAELFMDK